MKSEGFVKVVLSCISVGQVVVAGLCLLSGKPGIGLASQIYGARFRADKQFDYIIRPLGVYLLALSLAQFAAIRDPKRYRGVIDATIVLFALRQAQRWVLRGRISSTFGIEPERHARSSLFFAFWGLLLLAGRLMMAREDN